MNQFLLRIPDHLGDGVMAIPAVRAFCDLGPVQLVGPSWTERLYAGLVRDHAIEPKTAVLFKPSFSAAWKHRHYARRIGHRGEWRRWLLTDPIDPRSGHRTEEYAALARHVDATVAGPPAFETTEEERKDAASVSRDSVLLLPLSKSQATVGWRRFRLLAEHLGDRALFAAGPGECAELAEIAGPHPCLPPLDIGRFAAIAQRVDRVVGNDSGLAHLASAARHAVGLPEESVHVVFGSTTPEKTGPIGCTPHLRAPLPCHPCYRKTCAVADEAPCLEVDLKSVAAAIG